MSKRFEKNARPSKGAAGTVILLKCIKYLHFEAGLRIIGSDANLTRITSNLWKIPNAPFSQVASQKTPSQGPIISCSCDERGINLLRQLTNFKDVKYMKYTNGAASRRKRQLGGRLKSSRAAATIEANDLQILIGVNTVSV
ncbi:hypothetical protein HNY73_005228 [Argiope bruennichi]|uniref:Uncharacterized protein n=1 Tax=Argiope bruennichi TaxID=94029 RepID=A0A8T0FN05_ARGBR|nr:hypothetical protein HNY73_005228 [Argiope bruennichi]